MYGTQNDVVGGFKSCGMKYLLTEVCWYLKYDPIIVINWYEHPMTHRV